MAAMKKNAEITSCCFQGKFFTTILQTPTLPIQPSVMAIFKNPLTFDTRYGPSHPRLHQYNLQIFSIDFQQIYISLPQGPSLFYHLQTNTHPLMGWHGPGVGVTLLPFHARLLLNVFFHAATLQTNPLILLYFVGGRVVCQSLWENMVGKQEQGDSKNNSRAITKLNSQRPSLPC